MMKKLLLACATGLSIGSHRLNCKSSSGAEKVAEGLDEIYENKERATSVEEFDKQLQRSTSNYEYLL